VWVESRGADLAGLIARHGWTAVRPPEARLLSALKGGRLELLAGLEAGQVTRLRQACQDADASLARRARWALRHLQDPAAREAVCLLYLEHDDRLAEQAARLAGYTPRDPQRKALYFFISGRWQEYTALDFDHRLLRAAYAAAPTGLRSRMLARLRASGRSQLLTVIAGGDFRSRLALLAPDEVEVLLHLLMEAQDWPKLWEKAFELPFSASLQAVRALADSTWQPPRPGEPATLAELAGLARQELETSGLEARQHLPPALERARINLLRGRINALAFSPLSPHLALALSEQRVVLWDFQKMKVERRLGRFNASIGKLGYTRHGTLVFAERGLPSRALAAYALLDGQPTPIQRAGSAVTGIEAVGQSQVLLAEHNCRLSLFDLADGVRTVSARWFPFWAREIRVAPRGDQAALLHHGAALVGLPDLQPVDPALEGRFPTGIWRCAAFSPDGAVLIAGRSTGQVLAYDLASRQVKSIRSGWLSDSIQEIEALSRPGVLLWGTAAGQIEFTTWPIRATIGQVQHPARRLTSLTVSPDGAFMAVGDSQAAFSLWDLRLLEIPALFEQPFIVSVPHQLAAVQLALEAVSLPPRMRAALRYIERVLRHRFRFDIEIEALHSIRAGRYDIDIA
jgi:hypothetical protein